MPSSRAKAAGQHVHPVELGVRSDPVDFVHQLADFDLDLLAVLSGVDTVRGLHGQLAEALENVRDSCR